MMRRDGESRRLSGARASGTAPRLGYARPPETGPRPRRRPRSPVRPTPGEITLSDSETRDSETRPSTLPAWLLLVGAALGLGLAAFGLLEPSRDASTLSADTAAVVGERTIRRIDYERVLAGVEGDLRNPVDEAIRRRVLDRMIDEELLVQRALDLGLAVIDRRVRGDLTSGLIDSIVSDVDAEEPSEREIARHYEENVDFFSRPGRLRARTIFFSKRRGDQDPRGSASARAAQALEQLRAGAAAIEVERALGDTQVSPVPDTLLPPSKVRDYVGPSVLTALAPLDVAEWSEPIESGSGISLAILIEREPAVVPELAEVADLVQQDLKRRRGDEALRDYLNELRAQTPIALNERIFDKR